MALTIVDVMVVPPRDGHISTVPSHHNILDGKVTNTAAGSTVLIVRQTWVAISSDLRQGRILLEGFHDGAGGNEGAWGRLGCLFKFTTLLRERVHVLSLFK